LDSSRIKMGKLVRKVGNQIAIASHRIAAPGYTIYVADYAGGATPPHGWVYYAENVTADHFAPIWKQPTGPQDAYALGAVVDYNGVRWRSTIANNVWQPGVSGWKNADSDIPAWIQPTGAHDAYSKGAHVTYNSKMWESTLDANVWAPGVTGWKEVFMVAPGEPAPVPEWVQPLGAQDAYAVGAHVMHNGFEWVSTTPSNVWEPGVFGWTKV
jgi:hypothetical protein